MSHSPTEAPATGGGVSDLLGYAEGWGAIFEMSRQGSSWSGRERNCAFLNTGGPRFADISAVSGLDEPDDGRAAARVDWDLDGDLDLWLANRTGPRVRLFLNQVGAARPWVAVRLEGTAGNRDAVGARAELRLAGSRRPLAVATVRAGEGYLAQSSKWLHFGLGDAEGIESLTVRWPGGGVETFTGLRAGRRYRVVEGSGRAEEWRPPRRRIRLYPSRPEPPPVGGEARVVLTARPPMPELSYRRLDGGGERPLGLTGGPTLINLWASWCAPCVGELKGFAGHRRELEGAGLRIVALSVDEDPERARQLMAAVDPWFETGLAPARTLDLLDLLQKTLLERRERLPLPASFLVDGEGRLAVIYKGPLEAEELAADLELAALDPFQFQTRRAAVPFPGRWATYPPEPPRDLLAQEFAAFGYPEVAAAYRRADPEGAALVEALSLLAGGDRQAAAGTLAAVAGALRERLERDPADLAARRHLAVALAALDHRAEALELFDQVLAREPRDRTALFYSAILLAQEGEREAAEVAWERLGEVDPEAAGELRPVLDSLP